MAIMTMASALAQAQKERMFSGMTRRRAVAEDYSVDAALEIVMALGRQRTPRFVIDQHNRFAYENFVKWLHGDPTMQAIDPNTGKAVQGDFYRGIYIAGGTGTGKSWCMEIMAKYASLFKFPIAYGGQGGTLVWKTARAEDIVADFTRTTGIAPYKEVGALCIQDLGSEPAESVAMGNRIAVLRTLLEYRGDRSDCLTLITSNYSIKSAMLTKIYGERVASRLDEMCNYFEIRGEDRRKGGR